MKVKIKLKDKTRVAVKRYARTENCFVTVGTYLLLTVDKLARAERGATQIMVMRHVRQGIRDEH